MFFSYLLEAIVCDGWGTFTHVELEGNLWDLVLSFNPWVLQTELRLPGLLANTFIY